MTPSRRRICKPLARGSRVTLARQCLKDMRVRKHITKGVGLLLQREVAGMCSTKVNSILCSKTTQALEGFNWKDVIGEMEGRAPTLLSLLRSCTKTRKTRKYTNCVIGLIAAILCKHRRPSSCLVQRLISVILYSGHASKRVSLHLLRINLHSFHDLVYFICTKCVFMNRCINDFKGCNCACHIGDPSSSWTNLVKVLTVKS